MSQSACKQKVQGAGLEGFDSDDLRLPQLKLRQEETLDADRVPVGSWYLTSDPEGHSISRGLVLLEMRKERSLLLPWSGLSAREAVVGRIEEELGVHVPLDHEGVVCFSRDRLKPVEQEGGYALSERCATCPMARWRTVAGRRIQDCGESYRLLFWDQGAESACVYYARGAAIPAAKDLLTNVRVACRRFDLPACGFQVGLSAKKVRALEGSYFVPLFTRPYPHTDMEAWARYAEIREACAPNSAASRPQGGAP